MFSALFYLVWGGCCLFVGLTGKGLRLEPGSDRFKKAKKLLVLCGAVLLVGAAWELFDMLSTSRSSR